MTCFLRNAFLALVAFATLAILVMMAMTAEAAEAKDVKPAAETASSAITARQIVVEEPKDKAGETTVAIAKTEAAAEPVKPVQSASADAPDETTAPAAEAPAAEAAPAQVLHVVVLPKPKAYVGYVRRYNAGYTRYGYDNCD